MRAISKETNALVLLSIVLLSNFLPAIAAAQYGQVSSRAYEANRRDQVKSSLVNRNKLDKELRKEVEKKVEKVGSQSQRYDRSF